MLGFGEVVATQAGTPVEQVAQAVAPWAQLMPVVEEQLELKARARVEPRAHVSEELLLRIPTTEASR